ncbi:MAG: retroviral-like aspartic protease family protein [Chloroflexota bacterium]|nr:retroviral-like aspartic protease family protein [Chloroflexota bacterium]
MSIFHYPLEITGPDASEFQEVMALVDTGATFTQVPATLLRNLGVQPTENVRFRLADGSTIQRAIGETRVRIEAQIVNTVVVFGDDNHDALLGVYTLERALLAVDPAGQRLIPTDALLV